MKIVSLKCFCFRAAKLSFFNKYLNSVGNIFGRAHFWPPGFKANEFVKAIIDAHPFSW
jgi:hypothetical protein